MRLYRALGNRVYFRLFSQHIGFTLLGLSLWALSFTPVGAIELQYAVNQNLVFMLRFCGSVFLIIGFRGNWNFFKLCHQVIGVMTAIIPTLYVQLSAMLILPSLAVAPLFTLFSDELIDKEYSSWLGEIFIVWYLFLFFSVVVWITMMCHTSNIYKTEPENVDKKHRSVLWLLITFIGFTGAHRFYAKRYRSGVLYLFTGGLLGFGVIYDAITVSLWSSMDKPHSKRKRRSNHNIWTNKS